MKDYPHISRSRGQSFRAIPDATIFDKLDGSQIRVEWSGKRGIEWNKFGTRDQLLDPNDPVFSPAIGIFRRDWQDALGRIVHAERWERGVAFFEFWGPNSFAGQHDPEDEKHLTLIDVAPHRMGIMGPRRFLSTFGDLDVPTVVDTRNWTREYVEQVWRGEIPHITFEGVVAKGGDGHHLVMAKAKTEAWVIRVKELYAPDDADRIINS